MFDPMTPAAVRLRLADILKERQMTQQKLADKSGLTKQSVSILVRSPKQIRLETLGILIDTLDVDLCDLFEVQK